MKRLLEFLEKFFDKIYTSFIRLFFMLPDSVSYRIGKMVMIWICEITHVVFIYTILRLLLFVTFSFRFEFLMGISFLIIGVTISHNFGLKNKFYNSLVIFLAKIYSNWKFDVRIVVGDQGKYFTPVLRNPSPEGDTFWRKVLTFLPRMWYKWGVIYSAFYLIEYYFLSSMGFLILLILFFFKKYLLAYVLLFFINSGKVVVGLGCIGYDHFYILRDEVYYSRKFGLNPFLSWTIYWLEHRFLLKAMLDSAESYINLYINMSKKAYGSVPEFGFTKKQFRDYIFTQWIYHIIKYDPRVEVPGKTIDHLYWNETLREKYPKLYYKMDRLKTIANVISGFTLFYILTKGFFGI